MLSLQRVMRARGNGLGDSVQYEKAVNALYETVFQPERWKDTALECARLVNATTFFLQVAKPTGVVDVIAGHGLEGLGIPAYEAYYHKVDIWRDGLFRSAADRIHLYHEIVDQADYENSETFTDWVKPGAGYDIYWGLGSCLRLADGQIGFLAAHRSRRQGEMTEDDRANFQRLVPHVRRVLRMRHLASQKASRERGMETICDHASCAAILVDRKARLIYANKPAEALFKRNDALQRRADGTVEARSGAETVALQTAIAAACDAEFPPENEVRSRLRVTRASGAKPLIVSVCPVSAGLSSASLHAVVFIEDIWTPTIPSVERIRLAFGLTAAEARLISSLSEGLSLREAAGQIGIAYNTARAHLRSVLGKAGVTRQSELMLHVARLR
jgi:DNA-binding CsgD family transcriptional regulator